MWNWPNGEVYDGGFSMDAMTGKGKKVYENKITYEGTFLDGKKHGKGFWIFSDGKRYGTFVDGKEHGISKTIRDDNKTWETEFVNGVQK